jgi:hypothetical protein
VKENVFPKMKFANLDVELAFSNDPESICRCMAEKMLNIGGWVQKRPCIRNPKQIKTISSIQSNLDFKVSQMVADWLW